MVLTQVLAGRGLLPVRDRANLAQCPAQYPAPVFAHNSVERGISHNPNHEASAWEYGVKKHLINNVTLRGTSQYAHHLSPTEGRYQHDKCLADDYSLCSLDRLRLTLRFGAAELYTSQGRSGNAAQRAVQAKANVFAEAGVALA
ncbi:MAG: hypothetical protein EOO61_07525 [Hymenobacter sp.]|nr:MAG: hypothetical protein EOO61_07525 [Hymenobacter sp.]